MKVLQKEIKKIEEKMAQVGALNSGVIGADRISSMVIKSVEQKMNELQVLFDKYFEVKTERGEKVEDRSTESLQKPG